MEDNVILVYYSPLCNGAFIATKTVKKQYIGLFYKNKPVSKKTVLCIKVKDTYLYYRSQRDRRKRLLQQFKEKLKIKERCRLP